MSSKRNCKSYNLFIVKHNLPPVNTTIILITIVLVLIHNMPIYKLCINTNTIVINIIVVLTGINCVLQ